MASASGSPPDAGRARLRSGGLRRRLVLAFGSTSAAMILATLIPLGFVLSNSHRASYGDQLERQARAVVAGALASKEPRVSYLTSRFPTGGDVQALLLDRSGNAVTLDLGLFPFPPRSAPEVRAALAGQSGSRLGPSSQGQRLYVAVPVTVSGRIDGVLWLASVTDPVNELNRRTWAALGIIGAAAILFSVVVAIAVARQIARRLEVVSAGAERFAEGRFAEPIAVAGRDEIAALGVRLNEMATRIQGAVARERDFAAAASHQLRTPLTAIKLRIEELRSTLAPSDRSTAAEYLDEMGQEVDRLTFLTSGLLTMAAIEGGGVRFGSLPAAEAVEQAVQRVRPLARQGEVDVHLTSSADGVLVRAPRGAFEEVIFNVLDNAVKYSPHASRVDVEVTAAGNEAVVRVGDRGPGLSEEDAAHAFEPFFRSRSASRIRGSGLGLAICARLCEAAGASIALEGREGGGTLAVVRWPIASTSDED